MILPKHINNMITKDDFNAILKYRGTIVVDGALATELEILGHDLNHPLWSGKTLQEDPESIKKVHLDYYMAGADISITASYQASTQGLHDHFEMDDDEAASLIKRSVILAQEARDEAYRRGKADHKRKLLVAGSIGPYGAYLADGSEYRGDYQRSKAEFQGFHRPRIQALIEADVDVLAVETLPNYCEVEAILELLYEANAIAWLSCTLRDSQHISDGTPIIDLLDLCSRYESQLVAVGINCVPPSLVIETLEHMRIHIELPLLCYPNSGETWDATKKSWSGVRFDEHKALQEVREWQRAGAKLVGGCCRTGPEFIEIVARLSRERKE